MISLPGVFPLCPQCPPCLFPYPTSNHKMNLTPTPSLGPVCISWKVATEPKKPGLGVGWEWGVSHQSQLQGEWSPPQPSPNLAPWAPFSDLPAPESSPR